MDLVQKAALNVLKNGYKLKKGEIFVAVSDYKNRFFSDALKQACLELNAVPLIFLLDDYCKRPTACPEDILRALKNADAGTLCATEIKGETETFRRPFFDSIKNYKVRFASMTGINKASIETGLNIDFDRVADFTDKVYDLLKNASGLLVKTKRGTELEIDTYRYRWAKCTGRINPAVKDDNFPEGEVFTAPYNVNGALVVDGVLGDVFDAKYGIITKTPLRINISRGRARKKGFFCENPFLQNDIFEYLFNGKNANRVGEVALGTNICLEKLIGNLLQDEKFPSFHLAFGYPYPDDTGCKWTCSKHIDMVVLNPDVYADGKLIMKNGKYLI